MPTQIPTQMSTYLTTNQTAKILGVQPATIRRGLCVNGHYMGLTAHKTPNNRLLWLESAVRRLLPMDENREQ